MGKACIRIEVFYQDKEFRGDVICNKLKNLGFKLKKVYITDNYLINANISENQSVIIAKSLIQSVTQSYNINSPYFPNSFNYAIEIGFLPGVTDNVAHTVRESIEDSLTISLDPKSSVFTSKTFFFDGDITEDEIIKIAMEQHNPLIHRIKILSYNKYKENNGMGVELPIVQISNSSAVTEVNLDIPNDELEYLGREGIPEKDNKKRRGPLALDIFSLTSIKKYFKTIEKRNPTDIELESIAQTWSEHCKHTIFASKLDDIDEGIYKEYIKNATLEIKRKKGDRDFCVSVFEDNSGGIKFDENFIISDKVETHNSPSALDPFGGAITGIVGVNRDAIGFGLGAKPIANRFGFCFANPSDKNPLFREKNKESMLLSPRRIMEGVIYGVNVGGNHSGIPTPQGFLYFDDRYKGKPLVFVGTIGLLPATVNGISSVEKRAMPGDYIIVVGGRVGRDGIHGATFSSEALSSGSPATAVQIGDPITQKKLSDAIIKEARDKGLYSSITDNGAGGLSCSVAEMARESGGFEVELDNVPLKYPGLAPWQIWISESQERITLSVPPENLDEFLQLMNKRGIEASVIGIFTNSNRAIVKNHGKIVLDLDLDFLHNGLPPRALTTTYSKKTNPFPEFPEPEKPEKVFHDMISRLNTSSFEFISSQYDHEVQANSVIKPLQGKGRINGNTTVIRPIFDSIKGVVLSQSLYPSYSDIDTYWMAACSIDTAIRNIISVGGTLEHLALLDNFCWCDSNNPERLGQLKDAAKACYDFAVSYGTPFISGKDSMFNDFKGYNENFEQIFISIPPTLLISSIGIMENVYKSQTIDFKFADDIIYIIGETYDELGGSEYLAYMGEILSGSKYIGTKIPRVDPDQNKKIYKSFEQAMDRELISSSISIEQGGLGLALSKSAMSGMLGFEIHLSNLPVREKLRCDYLLYSESQGRLLVSVDPKKTKKFEDIFKGLSIGKIGKILNSKDIIIRGWNNEVLINTDVETLRSLHKQRFSNM